MKSLSSLFVVLFMVGSAFAQPPKLVIPSEVKPVDGFASVKPDTDSVSIVYISLDGLTQFPSDLLKDARYLVVPTKGEKAGKYRFIAVASSKTGEQVRVDFVIVVGNPPPLPDPTPVPDPTDPFTKSLLDAFGKESSPDKSKYVAALSSLYKMAATTTVNDPSVKTVGDLFNDLKVASPALLPPDAIPLIRKVVGDRLNKSIGQSPTSPIDRALVAKELAAVASALEGVK